MPDYIRSRTLFHSPLVTVSDVTCRPRCTGCSGEEYASSNALVFPRRGIFVKRVSEKRHIVAEPARVLFFNQDEIFRVSHPVAGGDDCTAFNFDERALVDLVRSVEPCIEDSRSRPFRSAAALSSSALIVALQRLRRVLRSNDTGDELRIEEMCVAVLLQSLRCATQEYGVAPRGMRDDTRQAHRELIASTQVVLAQKLHEKLSLAAVSRAVFSSPFHLARIFRRGTGLSLHQYRVRLRLRAALERLADAAPDLTMLAIELGFSSHAHFSHAFHREFGCAPSQLRSRLCSAGLLPR